MPSPILARADALINRKWQSHGVSHEEIPLLTEVVDDIPVLTDIAEVPPAPSTLPDSSEAIANTAPRVTPALQHAGKSMAEAAETLAGNPVALTREQFEQMALVLGERIAQRLHAELPEIIASALRDLLAEQAPIADIPKRD